MMDPALSRYWPLRIVSFVTSRAERLVEWYRRTSLRVELRSGQDLKAAVDSLISLHPFSPLLDSTARFANSSDRRS